MDVPFQKCSRCLKNGEIQCSLCNFAFYCSDQCLNKDKIRHLIQCNHARRVQQCGNCKQQKPKLKFCTQCFYVCYCDSECQKEDWVNHKNTCKKISTPLSNVQALRGIEFSFYLGTSISNDYLNLNNNESVDFHSDLSILMVGTGDIKNVVKTVTALPKKFNKKINFVLNDLSTHSVARNLLFLYLAIADPNPEHMVQIWYSIQLNTSCFSYLKRNLVKLATKPLKTILSDMKELIRLSEDHWNKCLKVWTGWKTLTNMDDLPEKVRALFFMEQQKVIENEFFFSPLEEAELDIYKNGLLLPPNSIKRNEARHPNVTLFCFNPAKLSKDFQELRYTDLHSLQWIQCGTLDEMIFAGGPSAFDLPPWLWTEVQKEKSNSESVLEAYESYSRKQFSSFSARVRKGLINFHLIIDSFKHVRYYLDKGTTFDRISVGHLGDVYLFPTLLQEFGDLLNKQNPHAVLLSDHKHWVSDIHRNIRMGFMDMETADAFQAAERLALKDNFKLPSSSLGSINWTLSISNYFDIWPYFFRYLYQQVLAYNVQELYEEKIVHPSQLAKKFNLRLRNYHCEQNKVIQCQVSEKNRVGSFYPKTITLEWVVDLKVN